MKETYTKAEMEIELFNVVDVIRTSSDDPIELPIVPDED